METSKPRPRDTGRIDNPSYRRGDAQELVGRIGNPSYDDEGVLPLYQLCCAHLDREQAHLTSTRDVLRQVHSAAMASKPHELVALLEKQKNIADATAAMQRERESFRSAAGKLLGLAPEAVTVREIARRLPPALAQHLLDRRQELHRLAVTVDGSARDLTLFCHYYLDFLQRLFVQLTGGRSSGRYGPAGLRYEPVCGALLQAQG